jgi:hypothetical protein
VGHGRLLVGYDAGGTIHVPDYRAYGSDAYDFTPYLRAEVGVDAAGRRSLQGLGTLDAPEQATYGDLVGPRNARVLTLALQAPEIDVGYRLGVFHGRLDVPVLPITRR